MIYMWILRNKIRFIDKYSGFYLFQVNSYRKFNFCFNVYRKDVNIWVEDLKKNENEILFFYQEIYNFRFKKIVS